MKFDRNAGYSDTAEILLRKAEGRRKLAALTFGEKIARMEALRDRLKPFDRLRKVRSTQPSVRS